METINLKQFYGLQLDQLQLLCLHNYHFVHIEHDFAYNDVEKLKEQESKGTLIVDHDIEVRVQNLRIERKVDDYISHIGFDLVRVN